MSANEFAGYCAGFFMICCGIVALVAAVKVWKS